MSNNVNESFEDLLKKKKDDLKIDLNKTKNQNYELKLAYQRVMGFCAGAFYGIYKGLKDYQINYNPSSKFLKLSPKNHFVFMMVN
jgi:hypothetical protein